MSSPQLTIIGAGKVGSALGRAFRKAGLSVTLRPLRRGLPQRLPRADLVILAVRDDDIAQVAGELAAAGLLARRRKHSAVVHCAGSLGADCLAALQSTRVSVGQMHPLLSFADRRHGPELQGAYVHIHGDDRACRLAARVSRAVGMVPITIDPLDLALYHAAAALLSNGAVALAAGSAATLEAAGADAAVGSAMLAPLLRSVADNLDRLGLPAALTGPVRRGDAEAVGAHLRHLAARAPGQLALYRALVEAQLPIARALNEASAEKFDAIARLLAESH
ncbi:MAG: DUF2520 domain-containing protein [Deltaproteobacteria bacterium]|nr:DUF2520 domain-containing protein [Deltaproteobacteria bacterium]